jgi:hypothetical protein
MSTRFLVVFLCAAAALSSAAQTTQVIAFQGRVSAPGGEAVADGAYRMSFTLFDAAEDGANLWTETDFNVPVSGGIFVRALGSVEPFPAGLFADNDDLFLEIAIDVDNNTLDPGDIQSPRTPLNAAPVALHAKDAAMLGGVPAQDIATSAELDALDADTDAALADKADQSGLDAVAADVVLKADSAAVEDAVAGRLALNGEAYVVVPAGQNPVQNGLALLAAYAEAKALTPHGAPLAADNRAVVVVPPGKYDLGTAQLTLDTAFVDLVGLTTERETQSIVGASSGPGTGVLGQTADDVRIANLRVECTLSAGVLAFNDSDPAAYFPSTDGAATQVTNCEFVSNEVNARSMRVDIEYAGVYTDCTGGRTSFGAGSEGVSSGVFLRCTAGNVSFGTFGIASGKFTDCRAGQSSFGSLGAANGEFVRCVAGSQSFANNGDAIGRFVDCSGGDQSFGSFGLANGEFIGCTGGDTSFGGGGGLANGVFVDCTGGSESFGGSSGTLGARLRGCQMIGDSWSGVFRGRMEQCRWTSTTFQLGAEGRVYASTFTGTVNLNNAAGGLTQSRAAAISNAGSNVFGATNAAAFNIVSAEVQ